jgi:DNA-packaging protein gp3
MAAPTGNSFWQARSSHGRKPLFESPDALWEACLEYFEWVEANPLWEDKIISFQGLATHVDVAKMRAMTVAGLCIFLDISVQTWHDYKERKDFLEVTSRVDEIIRTQKFQGAAADLLNPNIIARDLGLSDKSELTGSQGGPLTVTWLKS